MYASASAVAGTVVQMVRLSAEYSEFLPAGPTEPRKAKSPVLALRKKHAGVAMDILPPIGTQPRFKTMMRDLVKELL